MSEDRKKRAAGTATAVAGAGVAMGTPAVSRTERKVQQVRLDRIDNKIARTQAKMPSKPDPSSRLAGGRYAPEKARTKFERANKMKQVTGEVNRLNAKRKKIMKPKLYHKQTNLWATGLAVGVPLSYAGARKAVEKRADKHDVNAGYAGAVGGFAAYQGGSMALKPLDQRAEKKIRASRDLTRKQKEYQNANRPKNLTVGDPRWRPYFRNYPKDLPGGKLKRTLAVTHTGKSGGALTVGAMGAGAAGAVKYNRKRRADNVSKGRVMSDAEIRRRKKLQGHISQTTSTLGLGGLATLGAAGLAAKKPGALKKVPGLKNADPAKLKDRATTAGIVSGGIGGVGGYNFAAYTNAESRKKKPVTKSHDMDSTYGEIGKAENWKPEKSGKSPEQKRHKRAANAQLAGGLTSMGLAGGSLVQSGRSLNEQGRAIDGLGTQSAAERAKSGAKIRRLRSSSNKLGVAAVGAGAGSLAIGQYRKSKGFQTYSKSASASAFGITHD